MAADRFDWLRRIKAVEREHAATQFATDQLLATAELDPNVLQGDLALRDLRRASEGLEGTYLIRLFAEFETGLRLFWEAARQTEPPHSNTRPTRRHRGHSADTPRTTP